MTPCSIVRARARARARGRLVARALTLAPPHPPAVRGLAGTVVGATAKKGKVRVTLRLTKAPTADGGAPAAWKSLLKGGAAAPDLSGGFDDDFGGSSGGDE